MLTAFVMIHVEPGRIAEIAQTIANMPNVAEVYSVTGDFDILAIIRLPDYDKLAEVVPEELAKLEGIRRTNTLLAFRRFSAEDLKAAWDIGLS
jgi:DNA-binding Lrp family transcriptional regulator